MILRHQNSHSRSVEGVSALPGQENDIWDKLRALGLLDDFEATTPASPDRGTDVNTLDNLTVTFSTSTITGFLGLTFSPENASTPNQKRDVRWHMMRHLQASGLLLPRSLECMRRAAHNATSVGIEVGSCTKVETNESHRIAGYKGVARCEVSTCPWCSAKDGLTKARKIATVLREHLLAGGGAYLLTLTIPHDLGDSEEVLTDWIRKSWSALIGGRGGRALSSENVSWWIRGADITYGKKGPHPHYHVLVATPCWVPGTVLQEQESISKRRSDKLTERYRQERALIDRAQAYSWIGFDEVYAGIKNILLAAVWSEREQAFVTTKNPPKWTRFLQDLAMRVALRCERYGGSWVPEELESWALTIIGGWIKCVERKAPESFKKSGRKITPDIRFQDLRSVPNVAGIAEYLAKISMGAGFELRGHGKTGHGGSRSEWQLAVDVCKYGRSEDIALWRGHLAARKGRSTTTISTGARNPWKIYENILEDSGKLVELEPGGWVMGEKQIAFYLRSETYRALVAVGGDLDFLHCVEEMPIATVEGLVYACEADLWMCKDFSDVCDRVRGMIVDMKREKEKPKVYAEFFGEFHKQGW